MLLLPLTIMMQYLSLKKATYKPAAFYRGIILPLAAQADVTLREAIIFGERPRGARQGAGRGTAGLGAPAPPGDWQPCVVAATRCGPAAT